MGHMGGLTNPRPGRGQYRAGFSNTGGSPKPRKRAPCQKNPFFNHKSETPHTYVRVVSKGAPKLEFSYDKH